MGIGHDVKPHFDRCDKILSEIYESWFHECDKPSDKQSAGCKKLREMEKLVGIGMPTSCGYNFHGKGSTIFAHFVCAGFVTPITEESVHHFHGWSFGHCTAVAVAVQQNVVQTTNVGRKDEDCVFVGAWGRSGGSQHAVLFRNKRRLVGK